jgi:hypothetical protein
MNPADNQAINERCAALGLSLAQAQRLAGVRHTSRELANVLGLDWMSWEPLKPRRWLWMAANSASVTYRNVLTPERLLEVLTTGAVPRADVATIIHFLEELPLQVVVMSIDQAAHQSGVAIEQIWRNVDQISAVFSSTRLSARTA